MPFITFTIIITFLFLLRKLTMQKIICLPFKHIFLYALALTTIPQAFNFRVWESGFFRTSMESNTLVRESGFLNTV